eukprot:11185771-Lingulodinium_polyedra.AAC.1
MVATSLGHTRQRVANTWQQPINGWQRVATTGNARQRMATAVNWQQQTQLRATHGGDNNGH